MTPPNTANLSELRAREPRAFDCAVAEHVHGWRRFGLPRDRRWWLDAPKPEDRKKPWREDDPGAFALEKQDGWESYQPYDRATEHVPNYRDPVADYATMKLVRETWTDNNKRLWANRLYEVQTKDLSRWPQPAQSVVYLPGDYSEAALSVVLAPAAEKP